jgi:cytidyltransferase-like protein
VKIGFTNGCFDLFHEGHRHFLRQCAEQCNYLIVAVNSDRYCRAFKGPPRPFRPLMRRISEVRAFLDRLTDSAVIPFEGREARLLSELRPDILFKGGDHGKLMGAYIRPLGTDHLIEVRRIDRVPGISTTLIAERMKLGG